MKRALKILLIGAVIVVLLVAIGVTLVGTNINRIVKAVVEDAGTKVTGTSVGLQEANVSLRQGSGSLYGLAIANPDGFSTGNAFELGEISIDLELTSLGSDEIVLESVVVDGAQVNLEEEGGRTNLQELLEHMRRFAGAETTETEADMPQLVIKEFRFTNAKATLTTSRLAETVTISIPDLVLSDIGRKGTGVTAAEAGQQIMQPLIQKVLESAQSGMVDELKTRAVDRLGELLRSRGDSEPPPEE